MMGRDASASGGRAASQSPLRASQSNTSNVNLPASQRATERERLALKDQLAAWRERRDQHRLQQQQPKTPPQPRPFSLNASFGPSDEEKQLILQRRRELMRSPSKQPPPGASPPPNSRRNSKEDAKTPTSGPPPPVMRVNAAASGRAQEKPAPRTPPPRKANQNGPRSGARPPPPQTPPLAPRPPPSRIPGPRTGLPHVHGQQSGQRLSSAPTNGVVATESEIPHPPLTTLSSTTQTSPALPQHQELQDQHATFPELTQATTFQRDPPPSPPGAKQPLPASKEDSHGEELTGTPAPVVQTRVTAGADQRLTESDSNEEALASIQSPTIHVQTPSASSLPPPMPMTPPRRVVSNNARGASSMRPARQSLQASPPKHVRFAEEKTMERQAGEDDAGEASNHSKLAGVAHDGSDDDLLTDSQSSLGREMVEREQLMSEVDELIHEHTEEVIVTDRIVHRYTAADGREETGERVSRSHTEKSSSTHRVEEKILDERLTSDDESVLDISKDDQVDDVVRRELSSPVGHRVEEDPFEEFTSACNKCSEFGIDDRENAEPESGVRLRVVKSPITGAASKGLASPTQPSAPTAGRRVTHFRNAMFVSLFVAGLIAFDLVYPHYPVSRGLRLAKRVLLGLASDYGSRATVWLWCTVIHPASTKTCEMLVSSNTWLAPRAMALRSLVESGCGDLLMLRARIKEAAVKLARVGNHRGEVGNVIVRNAKSVFSGISSRLADALLYVSSPLMRPLPSIDPEAAIAANDRLQKLSEAQSQLRVKVQDLLRTQEEWALHELEGMKQRRVAYATATQSILTETTKMMLQAVQEAKLSAAEHIQEFTNDLAQELMSSIKPELDEYERVEAEQSHEQVQHEAALKKLKLEEAARLEILRVEAAKRQASAKLHDESSKDRKALLQDKLFVEVDVMEVVETVEGSVQDAVDTSASNVADSLRDTIGDVEAVAEDAESELEAVVRATEDAIERAEKRVVEDIVTSLAERELDLKREHDAAEEEIARLTGEEVRRLQHERQAAQELARATLLAEEAVIQEAEEARRVLDAELDAGKMELEQEMLNAASVAVDVEAVEVEKIVVEEEVIKKVIEEQLVEEVERLLRDVEQVESGAVKEVEAVEAELAELAEVAESTLDRLAYEEVMRLKREQATAEAKLNAVAFETEQQIASSAGIELPQRLDRFDLNVEVVGSSGSKTTNATPVTARSIVEDAERRHMVLLSIGFVVLALATAFVLYPRWRRLVANPTREAKAMASLDRRRRRRSWQQPAQLSDSEPEEVMLLQTGSSSEDGLSDSNEPEPEVVEMMSGAESALSTPQPTFSRTARTTYSSYSRVIDFTGIEEREGGEDDEEEEEEVSRPTPPTPPTRRALRRRRH